jgi:hypothetical protein
LSEKLTEKNGLVAPDSYWLLTNEERYELLNGCGPGVLSGVVPSQVFGANLKPACDIHDYIYAMPETVKDRTEADKMFLKNMTTITDREVSFLPHRILARAISSIYYFAVRLFGGRLFGD